MSPAEGAGLLMGVTFELFARTDGVRLRAGLVAAYGPQEGHDPRTVPPGPPRPHLRATDRGTLTVDAISFNAPLGPVGRAVERLGLECYMRRLIAEPGAFLKQAAEHRH